jgi:hypothetical protein
MGTVSRTIVGAAVFLGLAFSAAAVEAKSSPSTASSGSSYSANDEYYTNVDGRRVHRPVRANRPPPGASAKCRDGTYSFSLHRRGTCSYHGGVAQWL